MIAAPERIRVNCDLRHVNVVLCCDPKAFTHTNPLDGMSEGGSLVWESEEEGEQAWERLPLWARKQIIDNNIRVFTLPGFKIAREATDRGDLQLSHAGQRVPGSVLRRVADARRVRHHQRTVPRRGAQAVRQEVRPIGRRRREVQHGGDDEGVRAGSRDPRWRARGGRPVHAARQGAPADGPPEHRRRRLRVGLSLAPDPRGPGGTHSPYQSRHVRRRVPVRLRVRPARVAAGGSGCHGCRKRRHGVEVRRPA